jgi:hypothetical protein
VSEFDKAMVVAKSKGARERKRVITGKKVEGVRATPSFALSLSPWSGNYGSMPPIFAASQVVVMD